jgi:UDP:flavonoid glycosyltransferase YjiC (YdhE family)
VQFENFTWDWIYRGYLAQAPDLRAAADYLEGVFAKARYWLQAEPFCLARQRADGCVPPIGRRPRATVAETRAALGLADGERLVLVSLGGVPDQAPIPLDARPQPGVVYALAGAAERLRRDGPWLRLPHHSPVYYPDLVAASDAVIGKLGYSTVAEAYHAGVPFGYLPRAQFRESPILAEFVERQMPGLPVSAEAFQAGGWLPAAQALLEMPRVPRQRLNGADLAANFVVNLLG